MTQNDQMLLEKGAIDRLAQYKVATNLEFLKTHTHTHPHTTKNNTVSENTIKQSRMK